MRARLNTRHRFAPHAAVGRPSADEHPRRVHRKLLRCNGATMQRCNIQCNDARMQQRNNDATPLRRGTKRCGRLCGGRTGAMPARVLCVGLALSPLHIQYTARACETTAVQAARHTLPCANSWPATTAATSMPTSAVRYAEPLAEWQARCGTDAGPCGPMCCVCSCGNSDSARSRAWRQRETEPPKEGRLKSSARRYTRFSYGSFCYSASAHRGRSGSAYDKS